MDRTYQSALQNALSGLREKLMEKEESLPEALKEGNRALRHAIYGLERELRKDEPNIDAYVTKVTTEASSSNLYRHDTQKTDLIKAADKIKAAITAGVVPTLDDLLA